MVKLFFYGNDKRTKYLKGLYEQEKKTTENFDEASYVIFPIPFTKDGVYIYTEEISIDSVISMCKDKTIFVGGVPRDIKEKLEANKVKYIDVMALDEVAYLNAIPTAEGAIAKAMELADRTIHGMNILVLGFGRVGKILADKLRGLNANVFCEARKQKDLAHIKALGYNVISLEDLNSNLGRFDVIFSTIPAMILNEDRLKLLKKDAVIIDLASRPGSVDYEEAEKMDIKAVLELGIPSKVAPLSAAEYLKYAIDNVINN